MRGLVSIFKHGFCRRMDGGEAFEMVSLRVAVERKEVVPDPDAVNAQRVGLLPCLANVVDGPVLRMNGDANLESGGRH